MVEGSKNKMRRTREPAYKRWKVIHIGTRSRVEGCIEILVSASTHWWPTSRHVLHSCAHANKQQFQYFSLPNTYEQFFRTYKYNHTKSGHCFKGNKSQSHLHFYKIISKHNNFLTSINTAMQYHQVFWMSLASVDGINKHNHDINVHLQNLTEVILSISGSKPISQDTSLIFGVTENETLLMLLGLTLLNF